jgi:integrase
MRLTDRVLPNLTCPPGRTELKIFDDTVAGFGLRIRTGGQQRWIYQYDCGQKTKRITLGSPKSMTTARARAAAAELQARVRLGQDPAGDKAESRIRSDETFEAILRTYLARQRGQLKPLSYGQKERHLLRNCRPFHTLPLVKIDRRTVAAKLAKVTAKSGPYESNRTRASLSAFFTWCISEGYVDANPVIGTNRNDEITRDRVLTNDELKVIWAATDDEGDYSAIVRLLLLTGCRAAECGSVSWAEIVDGRIVLPAARTKNARDHVVPLSAPAQTILEARPRMLDSDFVFGRARSGRGLTGWSSCKTRLDARIKAAGVEIAPWRIHDCRRTVATGMAELGVLPHIIEAVLNHVSGHKRGVAGVYNRATYENEKRAALILWADHLMHVVVGEARKVVPLRA